MPLCGERVYYRKPAGEANEIIMPVLPASTSGTALPEELKGVPETFSLSLL